MLELCASAGFAGVVACDINCGVLELLSDFGVVVSGGGVLDCGVVALVPDRGVVLLSGAVVVVLVEFVVVLLAPLFLYVSVAGFAHGSFAGVVELPVDGVVAAVPLELVAEPLCGVVAGVVAPVVLLGVALSCVLDGVAGVEVVLWVVLVVVVLWVALPFVSVELGGVVVLVLWARAHVPVRSNPAANSDSFFI